MADISTIQPSNLNKPPMGEPLKTVASSDFQKTNKQDVAQEIVQKKAEISQLKSQDANGQIDAAALDSKMVSLNKQLQQLQNYLKFERDEDSNKMVVFIKNSETNELIRQIPTQEFLAIAKHLDQYLEMRQQFSAKITPPVGMITNETV